MTPKVSQDISSRHTTVSAKGSIERQSMVRLERASIGGRVGSNPETGK